jgi:serine phosphatase RsbU (regulator of sigma subunit)
MLSVLELAVLLIVWRTEVQILNAFPFWTACLSALLVSVLFAGGVSLIEPLFVEIAKADELLQQEKRRLEDVVQETEAELRMARQIQQRLLPRVAPRLAGFDLAGASIPAEWTSGDYFDFLTLEDGTLAIVIADVSGHGVGPALLMTATRAQLRSLARTYSDIGKLLTIANRTLADDVDQGRFVTMFLAQIDPRSRQLVYTSAGHDGVLLESAGEVRRLDFGGPPLGAVTDTVIGRSEPVTLKPGDVLLLVSDGIPDTESASGEHFGQERMLDIVWTHRDKPAREIVDTLLRTVRDFAAGVPHRDDITAVVVKCER